MHIILATNHGALETNSRSTETIKNPCTNSSSNAMCARVSAFI